MKGCHSERGHRKGLKQERKASKAGTKKETFRQEEERTFGYETGIDK